MSKQPWLFNGKVVMLDGVQYMGKVCPCTQEPDPPPWNPHQLILYSSPWVHRVVVMHVPIDYTNRRAYFAYSPNPYPYETPEEDDEYVVTLPLESQSTSALYTQEVVDTGNNTYDEKAEWALRYPPPEGGVYGEYLHNLGSFVSYGNIYGEGFNRRSRGIDELKFKNRTDIVRTYTVTVTIVRTTYIESDKQILNNKGSWIWPWDSSQEPEEYIEEETFVDTITIQPGQLADTRGLRAVCGRMDAPPVVRLYPGPDSNTRFQKKFTESVRIGSCIVQEIPPAGYPQQPARPYEMYYGVSQTL